MKKTTVFFICVFALMMGCVGCVNPTPRPYVYQKLVLPTDSEGKKCTIECKKIQLKKEQLSVAKNSVPGARGAGTDMSTLDKQTIDLDYKKCVLGCGAKYETRAK